jgi:translation initiation factor IF-2
LATKKIRVYELARELGVENAVVLELAEELKVGVKSHSSSIDEPSADRIRRLADSKGLKREPIVEEPPAPAPEPEPVVEAPAPEPVAPEEPEPEPEPAPPPHRIVRSTGGIPEPPPRVEPTPRPAPEPLRPAAQAPSPGTGLPPAPTPQGPQSLSGKPVPPPPGTRPIPPPPGRRAGGPPQASFRRTPPPGGDIGAPGAPRGGRPGGPPGRGGGPGQRRGPGGPQHRPKRKRRRRSTLEELEPQEMPQLTPLDAPVPEGDIVASRGITIQELAPKLNRTAADLVRLLFDAGEMVTGTQSLADEMIDLIADALGATVILVEPGQEAEQELQALLGDDDAEDDEALLEARAPVVTVMGHVDHGKTTLLDAIRHTDVVAGEAGGITQHIGAYQVQRDGHKITFIDTPGHEAFTAMRARGAQATDIAVLVVSADDGVMPQTVEAISHARAAEVPIVVAVTKVDREDADPTRVRQQLSERELVPEEWGGDTIVTDVSAPDGTGIDQLLESLVVVSEVEELKANPKAPARAFVLEAQLEPGRGPVVTALVERGTLRLGDPVVAGGAWGRIRAMFDDQGQSVSEAGPSVPVEVLGLDDVPLAGDELRVAPDDKTARTVAEARARRRRAASLAHPMALAGGARLEDIFAMVQRGEVATLGLVLKADVQGSLEALTEALRKLDQEHDEVRLSFVHRAVGGITESDVNLASVSTATIVGFNVRPDRKAREVAEALGVEMRLYEVIYQVLEDVNAALIGMLEPEFEEVVTGEAEVREVFSIPRVGKIAGCYVRDGVITRGSKVRFLRDGVVIWNGQIASLKRFKDDAREVASGFECGIGLENYQDLESGDVIETYEVREIARST